MLSGCKGIKAGVLAALPLDPEAARFYSLEHGAATCCAARTCSTGAEIDPKFSLVRHVGACVVWLGYEQVPRKAKKAFDLSPTCLSPAMLVEGEYYEAWADRSGRRRCIRARSYHPTTWNTPALASAQSLSGHGTQAMDYSSTAEPAPSSMIRELVVIACDER